MASPSNDEQRNTLNQSGPTKSVAVVGGGVSGLAAAYKLKVNGLKVTVFEAEDRTGGKLKSCSQDGFIWDEGANTMTESEAEVGKVIDELGLRQKQQVPISQNKRYIVKNGVPELIPSDPFALIKSTVLSPGAKFKIILEPFLWNQASKKSSAKVAEERERESVGKFFQRHFGTEVVDYLIDPFVAGTNGADPESLSICHAFPELWNLEKKFGSIILGVLKSKMSSKSKHNITNESPDGAKSDNAVLFHSMVECRWSISYSAGHGNSKEILQEQSFDAIIMTAPLSDVQEMKFTKERSPFVLDFLPKVSYLPLSVLITSFKKENVRKPLEGFGVLVPSKEQKNRLRTLGTLFSSMMFPDRAPSNQYLYTTFIGGSRNRDLAEAPLDQLKQIVVSDLGKLLGAEGEPTFVKHIYWKKAFPLYGHDYDQVLEAIDKMEKDLPGFFYAGNHKDGLSVGKALSSGCKAADLVISYLNSTTNS